MDKIQEATNFFLNGNSAEAEKTALSAYFEGGKTYEAADILAAIFLRENKLECINKIDKSYIPLIIEIAGILFKLKMFEQSVFFHEILVKLMPSDISALNNLGLAYNEIEETEKAKLSYEKSIRIKENFPALYNLGVLFRKTKELQKSKVCLTKARNMNPDDCYINYSLGMTYLMEKDFAKGYPYFMKRPVNQPGAEKLKNFWDGTPHPDKTLFVFCEYGFGDAIQFSRYFPLLKERFREVKVLCKPQLRKLFAENYTNIEFVEDIHTAYDFCTYVMDLPYLLGIDFDNIPFADGYLKADEEKVKLYKEKYFNNSDKKIGIFFIGGELEKPTARYRAIPLACLSGLFSIKNTKFYSFQKDDIFDELKDYPQLINLGDKLCDFSDTAAMLKNLDLFVTVDSAPVHLAGALGVKTFLMLPYYSEWRWFSDEKNTPWYNSVELFRQTTPCEWLDVADNIYNKI